MHVTMQARPHHPSQHSWQISIPIPQKSQEEEEIITQNLAHNNKFGTDIVKSAFSR